ncbi:hypothetical protein ACQP00_17540 [Dactylosporangium sp. CS-047395]|uniref:hypothetical protein n=1 Tax=Dactylosporangium sp. CS-047395 TaxID=3239936 RepID=UPI003D8CB438
MTEVERPGGAVQALRVPCWVDQALIGLGDLMHLVGDGGALRWRLFWVDFIGDVRAVWQQGHEKIEAQSRQSEGLSISWSQMTALAGTDAQILDGEFVGFQDSGAPQLQFIMLDSSFWIVWSARADYADLRAAFGQAVMVPHELPASLVEEPFGRPT